MYCPQELVVGRKEEVPAGCCSHALGCLVVLPGSLWVAVPAATKTFCTEAVGSASTKLMNDWGAAFMGVAVLSSVIKGLVRVVFKSGDQSQCFSARPLAHGYTLAAKWFHPAQL